MTEIGLEEMKQRVEIAKTALAEAQRDLALAMGEMDTGRRADKRHVGEPLKMALQRLRVAQTELAALVDLLAP
jgi:hypothetical protein